MRIHFDKLKNGDLFKIGDCLNVYRKSGDAEYINTKNGQLYASREKIVFKLPSPDEPLTKNARKKHIQTAGIECCPFCKEDGDDAIEYDEIDHLEDGSIEQKAKCNVCNRKWMDVFRLVEVQEIV